MKRSMLGIFLALCVISCNRQFLSPAKSGYPQEASSYCELLHVPPSPHTPLPNTYLGVYLSSKNIDLSFPSCQDGSFVQVTGTVQGSPAERAGLMTDDLILRFNGVPTCERRGDVVAAFRDMIGRQEVGSAATIEVLRGDKRISLSATLGRIPTRSMPEAMHPDIEACDGSRSELEDELERIDSLSSFYAVRGGLYRQTNAIKNPDVPDDTRYDSLQPGETTFMMRHPLASGEAAKELSHRTASVLHDRNWRLDDMVRNLAGLIDIDLSEAGKPAEVTFPELLRTMEKVRKGVETVLGALTPEEKSLLREKALKPWDDERWDTIVEVSMKVDRKGLLSQFAPLLSFLRRENLSLLREDLIRRFGDGKGPVLYEAVTPVGKVIVGGPGPNVYREDAALILDLGGDDIYLNNAGGARPGMPAALVVDWEGNDRYMTKEYFSQGAAVLGGGFLLDLSGDDTFISLDGSQGSGFFGLGVLYHGDGDAMYDARMFSQGVGQMGIGLLRNGVGKTLYRCLDAGQALGLFGGVGVLLDRSGSDIYQVGGLVPDFRDSAKATESLGQGFGFGVRPEKGLHGVPGGIGMLIDEEGDDIYSADYFAQGAAYFYGLGILSDLSGNDQYFSGRYSQGAGIHSAVGVLADHRGNDFYYASFGVGQGMGHDFGVGVLEDDAGDDRYVGGTLTQGAATYGGLGLLLDIHGRNGYLFGRSAHGFAEESDCVGIVAGPRRQDGLDKSKASFTIGIKAPAGG
jgi:hypothetical protein